MQAQIYALVKLDNDYGIYNVGSCTTKQPRDREKSTCSDWTDLVFYFDRADEDATCILFVSEICFQFWDQQELGCTEEWLVPQYTSI